MVKNIRSKLSLIIGLNGKAQIATLGDLMDVLWSMIRN
jgi:hypothetical protein